MQVMKTPKTVDIDITNQCNLRCSYCFHFNGPADVKQDLPKEEWLSFFEELNRCAVLNVCISGGEPFCRKDLPELIEGIVKNRMRFNILSNGTLITNEIARLIASTKRCDGIQVSIDSSNPATHDTFRGQGSFLLAMEGIKHIRNNGLALQVRVTLNKKNIYELDDIATFLLVDLNLPSFSINAASYFGLCQLNSDEVQLSVSDRTFAMEKLLTLNQQYNGRIKATAGPLAEARIWSTMERDRLTNKSHNQETGHLTGCGCTRSKIAVRADGMIVPCNMLSHIELGRINQDSLKEVWQTHPALLELRERNTIPLSNFDDCKDCDYIAYCTGNCPGLAYTLTGKVNYPSPDACLKRFLQEGGKLPDRSLLPLEKA